MSGILEALDMMYEVKGDAENSYAQRRLMHKIDSEQGHRGETARHMGKFTTKRQHEPYKGMLDRDPMRNADDYRKRRHNADIEKSANRMMGECTETLDTLEGILS